MGDADKHEQARLVYRTDDLPVYCHACLGDSLDNCSHSTAGYPLTLPQAQGTLVP